MNTAYEIEYNALKGTVEEISNRVDDLVEKVSSFGGNRPGIDFDYIKYALKQIEEKSHELESETLRFLVEHRPKDSDLRSVLVLARLGSRFAEIGLTIGSLVDEFEAAHPFNKLLLKITGLMREVFGEFNNGIIDEDFDSDLLTSKICEIQNLIHSWYGDFSVELGRHQISPEHVVNYVRYASSLEQTGRLLKAVVTDLVYMITGSYDSSSCACMVLALE